ncbi:SVEP1-like protein [Mya arenaria]|uniref:SVEP1-like protein n=1 Tax=Mya arenaria TaxID=6604 RepID=A0ABY7GAH3_MYAAR|nr:SVEP1-like protein [Mya arenaria]
MHFKLTNSTRFGNEALFDCSAGHAIQGPERKRCYDTGIWEPNELNECIPYECGELVYPDNGYIISNGTSFDSHLVYICLRGYEIQGPSSLRCNETGHWFPEEDTSCIPKCAYIKPQHHENTLSQISILDSTHFTIFKHSMIQNLACFNYL